MRLGLAAFLAALILLVGSIYKTPSKQFKVSYRKHREPGLTGCLVDHTAGRCSGAGQLRGTLPRLQAGNRVAPIDLRKAGNEIALEHSVEVQ